jgi:hypothetical protein
MITKRCLPAVLLGLLAASAACVEESGDELSDDSAPIGAVSSEIISSGRNSAAVTDIPFYFAVPKHSLAGTLEAERLNYPWSTVWSPSTENPELGLRIIAIPETGPDARKQMSEKLGAAGVLQDGDIVLSFRTFLADTMAYPHIQMGSTHAGMVFLEVEKTPTGGERVVKAHNLDQPLDTDYNKLDSNSHFVGSFDSKHYVGEKDSTDALHILRPRWGEDRARRTENLRNWIKLLGEKHQSIRAAGGMNFNSDYLKPLIATGASAAKIATEFGQIMLGIAPVRQDFDMFCSEMSFYLLTLSNCQVDELRPPSTPVGGEAACAQTGQPFTPMKLLGDGAGAPGLAEGPLLGMRHLGSALPSNALSQLFPASEGPGASKLSAGHRAVAQATKPLMGGVQAYYTARLAGMDDKANMAAAQVNSLTGNVANYSPTAFLVQAMIPFTPGQPRTIDYVATIMFTDRAATERAKSLARPGAVPPE